MYTNDKSWRLHTFASSRLSVTLKYWMTLTQIILMNDWEILNAFSPLSHLPSSPWYYHGPEIISQRMIFQQIKWQTFWCKNRYTNCVRKQQVWFVSGLAACCNVPCGHRMFTFKWSRLNGATQLEMPQHVVQWCPCDTRYHDFNHDIGKWRCIRTRVGEVFNTNVSNMFKRVWCVYDLFIYSTHKQRVTQQHVRQT